MKGKGKQAFYSTGMVQTPTGWSRDPAGHKLNVSVDDTTLKITSTFSGYPIIPPLEMTVERGASCKDLASVIVAGLRQYRRAGGTVDFEPEFEAHDSGCVATTVTDFAVERLIALEAESERLLVETKTRYEAVPKWTHTGVFTDGDGKSVVVLPTGMLPPRVENSEFQAVCSFSPGEESVARARLLHDLLVVAGGGGLEYGEVAVGYTPTGKLSHCGTCSFPMDTPVECGECPRAYHPECVPLGMSFEAGVCSECETSCIYQSLKHLLKPLVRNMMESHPRFEELLKTPEWREELDSIRPTLVVGGEVVVGGVTTTVTSVDPVATAAGHTGDFVVEWGGGDIPVRLFKTG